MGDYRIASGIVAERWTTHQRLLSVNLGNGIYKILWAEPTGNIAELCINFKERWLHGMFSMPTWVVNDPEYTVCHQASLEDA